MNEPLFEMSDITSVQLLEEWGVEINRVLPTIKLETLKGIFFLQFDCLAAAQNAEKQIYTMVEN